MNKEKNIKDETQEAGEQLMSSEEKQERELEDINDEDEEAEGLLTGVDEDEEEEEDKENPEDFEDMQEITNACIRCGLCNSVCPVYKVMRDKLYSPEGKMILLDKGKIGDFVYDCTLCGQCEKACPLDLKIREAILKARKILVDKGKGSRKGKEEIEKLRKEGKI